MGLLNPILLILAGILALSGLIIAKRPDAKQAIDRLVPYQAMIGVAALVAAVVTLIRNRATLVDSFNASVATAALWGMIGASILLGFLFGMPLIARWIPGNSSAEQKMSQLSKQLAPFQVLIGVAGIVAAIVTIYFYFKMPALSIPDL